MADIQAAVVGYLTERDWPHEILESVIVTPVYTKSGDWMAFFEVREDDQVLIVYSGVPVMVPAEHRMAVARYLTRANYGLALGNFELDLDSGEVRFRTSVDVEGAAISAPIIDHLFLANVVSVERYLAGLRSVIDGADPDAAVAAAENPAEAVDS